MVPGSAPASPGNGCYLGEPLKGCASSGIDRLFDSPCNHVHAEPRIPFNLFQIYTVFLESKRVP